MSWVKFCLLLQSFVVLGCVLGIGNSVGAQYIYEPPVIRMSLPGDNNNAETSIDEPQPTTESNLNEKEDLKELNIQGAQDPRAHLADGAYPVYYIHGYANGQFNGKIYVLKD